MNPGRSVSRTPFSNGRVRIRPIGPSDLNGFWAALMEAKPLLHPWMTWADEVQDEAAARGHLAEKFAEWERGEGFHFAVESADDGAFLGMCGLSQLNWRHFFANVGYWVRPQARGHGVTPAAVLLLARFGFDVLRLNRVEILIEPANQASRRVAEKVGARPEGMLRARIQNRGQARDALMFSLIPADLADSP